MSKRQWGHGYWQGFAAGRQKEKLRWKISWFLNGWTRAPHCWKVMLFKHPFAFEKLKFESNANDSETVIITILGFVWFIDKR